MFLLGIDMTMIEVEIDMEEMSAAIIGEILIGKKFFALISWFRSSNMALS